jgi:hypothetical protein
VVINIYAGRPRRVGMAREGASCSPDYVPAPDMNCCAEAQVNVFWLESSSIDMNIVNVRKKRGNALNPFRPLLAHLLELVPRTTIANCLVAVAEKHPESTGASPIPKTRCLGGCSTEERWPCVMLVMLD